MAYAKPRQWKTQSRPRPTYRPKKVIYKKRAPAKSTAIVAKKALSLARYNNKLAYGNYQTNLQIFRRPLKITADTPACFNMTTPKQGESVFQFLADPQAPGVPLTFSSQTATQFQVPSLEQLTGGPGTGGNDTFNLWKDANDDNLNGKYKLLTTHLQFTIKSVPTQSQTIRYRIDFVRPRWNRNIRTVPTGTNVISHNNQLPGVLGSFNNILDYSNKVNPMYWTQCHKPVFFTVRLGNLTQTAVGATSNPSNNVVQKTIKITHNEVINPIDIGTALQDQPFRAISQFKQMWCIISSDALYSNSPSQVPDVYVNRITSWRDKVGHAA